MSKQPKRHPDTLELRTLAQYTPLPEHNKQYPFEYIERNNCIKLLENDDEVHVGICDGKRTDILEELIRFHRKKVVFFRIEKSELSAYLSHTLSILESEKGPASSKDSERLLLDKLANDAPIINLVNSIFIDSIRADATDIHIEAFTDNVVVRYRIDGELRTIRTIDEENFPAISSRIKIMGNLNIMERRLPQDGRISVNLGDEVIDIRVSIVPTARGESIAIRLFNKNTALFTLDDLGFPSDAMGIMRTITTSPHGLFLVTGPTGCGKTTTLNAVLRELKDDTVKIITIEDPIEYVIDGINQIQTNDKIGLTFDMLLRRVLRQDPNIIMVGEIRDVSTAELAIRSALTGHLVLSTLHTNDAVSVIPRLRNMGIDSYLVAGVLRGAMAQRLVRRLCTYCKAPGKPTQNEQAVLARYGMNPVTLFKGRGCKECGNTGYKGRCAIMEIFPCAEQLQSLIARDADTKTIRKALKAGGIRTLAEDGLRKAQEGITTIDEVLKAVSL